MPTWGKHPAHIRSAAQVGSLAYKLTKTQQLLNTPTKKNSLTSQPTNLPTHTLINLSTQKLTPSYPHQLTKLLNLQTNLLKNL